MVMIAYVYEISDTSGQEDNSDGSVIAEINRLDHWHVDDFLCNPRSWIKQKEARIARREEIHIYHRISVERGECIHKRHCSDYGIIMDDVLHLNRLSCS